MKRPVVVTFLVLASLILVPSAISAAPTIQRFPIDTTLVDTVDCAFPVQMHLVGTDVEIISGDRVFDAFPEGVGTLTNLDTGTTIRVSLAGTGHATFGADGPTIVSTGPALIFGAFSALPGIHLINGRFVLTFDSQGNPTLNSVGEVRDICAELAG
jgi:hypothetical protein